MTVIVGVDLSLRGTGLVAVRCDDMGAKLGNGLEVLRTLRLHTDADEIAGFDRLAFIESAVLQFYTSAGDVTAVAFEGAGLASQQAHSLGALHGIVKLALWRLGASMFDIPPSTLKKFVTGKGHSEKQVVMKRVLTRWGFDDDDDNVCDAFACCMAGVALFGAVEPPQRKEIVKKVKLYESARATVEAAPVAGRVRRRVRAG